MPSTPYDGDVDPWSGDRAEKRRFKPRIDTNGHRGTRWFPERRCSATQGRRQGWIRCLLQLLVGGRPLGELDSFRFVMMQAFFNPLPTAWRMVLRPVSP